MNPESYSFWIILWKAVFILGLAVFAGMAVWVTIGGARDIRRMLERIKEEHEHSEDDDGSS